MRPARSLICLCLLPILCACTLLTDAPSPDASATLVGSCSLGLGAEVTDEDAIRLVLEREGQWVVEQTIDSLMALWAEDSFVADAKNSRDSADDQLWRGKDAIRHRYVRIVFPGAPTAITPADLDIQLTNTRAEVIATTQIGSETAKAGDRWTLVQQDDCWLIESLTYNLEPK